MPIEIIESFAKIISHNTFIVDIVVSSWHTFHTYSLQFFSAVRKSNHSSIVPDTNTVFQWVSSVTLCTYQLLEIEGSATGRHLDASSIAIKVVVFGAVETYTVCVKCFAVYVKSRFFNIEDTCIVDNLETWVALCAYFISKIEWFTERIDLNAHIVRVKVKSFGTLQTHSIFPFFAIGVSSAILNHTSYSLNFESIIASQTVTICYVEWFADRVNFIASSIDVLPVISCTFHTGIVLDLCASHHCSWWRSYHASLVCCKVVSWVALCALK